MVGKFCGCEAEAEVLFFEGGAVGESCFWGGCFFDSGCCVGECGELGVEEEGQEDCGEDEEEAEDDCEEGESGSFFLVFFGV